MPKLNEEVEQLERQFPFINWRAPLSIALIDNPEDKHLACRICIALFGLKGEDVPKERISWPDVGI